VSRLKSNHDAHVAELLVHAEFATFRRGSRRVPATVRKGGSHLKMPHPAIDDLLTLYHELADRRCNDKLSDLATTLNNCASCDRSCPGITNCMLLHLPAEQIKRTPPDRHRTSDGTGAIKPN
jgi:hypothetical protein